MEARNLFLKFLLSDFSPSQSFLKVFNPLFQFHNIALPFMDDRTVVKCPLSSLEVLGRVFDPFSQQSVDFVLDEQESSVELVSLFSLDGEAGVG